MPTFKAMVIEKADGGTKVALADFDEANLTDGDGDVAVEYSTTNLRMRQATIRSFPADTRNIHGQRMYCATPRTPDLGEYNAIFLKAIGLRDLANTFSTLRNDGARATVMATISKTAYSNPNGAESK